MSTPRRQLTLNEADELGYRAMCHAVTFGSFGAAGLSGILAGAFVSSFIPSVAVGSGLALGWAALSVWFMHAVYDERRDWRCDS
jgi:hypothetical protein